MESFLFTIMDAAETIFHFVWFPVLVWTIIGLAVWMMVRQSDRVHPQYHYHTRLGLIFALPAGLLMLAILQWVQSTFMGSTEGNLVFVTVMAPLDIGTANQQESASLSLLQWSVLSACFVYFTGMLVWLFQLASQWFHLQRIKRQYTFTPLCDLLQADQLNLQTDRPVNISFVSEKIVPVTFGYRNPVILVPSYLADQPEKLVLAIRHELTHIRERDFLTHLFVSVSSALFWFHPLIHKLKRELTEYREIRCDRLVLAEPLVSKKEYASLLFELLPMPNLNKELSVNMAQESTNLKKRITMITQNDTKKPIPTRSSLAILSAILLSTVLAMACTDMQTQNVFDEEELDLMTDYDSSGERDYQQILIYMGDDEQADRHDNALENLNRLQPEYIESITVLKGEKAVEEHGQRASNGVIVVRTKDD
ncbi:MAG: M56 family metallopeptidase, partial [Balneolaceae bacterium]